MLFKCSSTHGAAWIHAYQCAQGRYKSPKALKKKQGRKSRKVVLTHIYYYYFLPSGDN